ncbi:hypothetical protein HDU67_003081 [Dinochytrium kinnereticum]|nr:hypothetical protein HDU67_003081 [Dinochytrium kinnereticum]
MFPRGSQLDSLHYLATELSDPQACLTLAQVLLALPDGQGRSVELALQFFEEAAHMGMVEGARSAATIYHEGSDEVPRNGKKARHWMRMAAELGFYQGWGILGDWYWGAAENDKDDDDKEFDVDSLDLPQSGDLNRLSIVKAIACMYQQKAIEAWKMGAREYEDVHCINRIADHYVAEDRIEKASALWERASAKGDIKAAKALVKVHAMKKATGELEKGQRAGKKAILKPMISATESDPSDDEDTAASDSPRTIAQKYIKYSEIAASAGDPSYLSQFASLNHEGLSAGAEELLPRNPPLALDLYIKAHEAGAPSSHSLLSAAYILMEGDVGIPQDRVRALELFVEAAREGSVAGLVAVADAYMEGVDGPPDYQRSFALYSEAEKLGDVRAAWKLGDCYRKAAEAHDSDAIRRLAQCYWDGEGCEHDPVKAERLMASLKSEEAFF